MINVTHAVLFAAAIFSLGLVGLLARRHLIMALVGLELMLSAANLNLVAIGRLALPATEEVPAVHDATALFVILIAACEVAVGLGIIIGVYRRHGTVSLEPLREMKE